MALELVCGADFWCNRHCRTSPVVLEGLWGQVWPKICRKPARLFPARLPSAMDATKPYEFMRFGAMDVTKPYISYEVWGHGCHQTLKKYRVWGHGCHQTL